MRLFIDVETRGPNFSQGLAKYALTAEVIMVQWAIDDGPVRVEDLTVAPLERRYWYSWIAPLYRRKT